MDAATESADKFQSTLPMGGATIEPFAVVGACMFQSTLPVGGATTTEPDVAVPDHVSIHAPRGGSDVQGIGRSHAIPTVPIHAPRGGSDANAAFLCYFEAKCQSTLPVGGATHGQRH